MKNDYRAWILLVIVWILAMTAVNANAAEPSERVYSEAIIHFNAVGDSIIHLENGTRWSVDLMVVGKPWIYVNENGFPEISGTYKVQIMDHVEGWLGNNYRYVQFSNGRKALYDVRFIYKGE